MMRLEVAEARVAGYRLADPKCNEDIGEEIVITDINTVKKIIKKALQHF
jgi:hypothetical protein